MIANRRTLTFNASVVCPPVETLPAPPAAPTMTSGPNASDIQIVLDLSRVSTSTRVGMESWAPVLVTARAPAAEAISTA